MTRDGAIAAAGAAFAIGLGAALDARFVAPYAPILERVAISGSPLAPAGELRIGFVTDTHIGPMISAANVRRALDLLLPASPDILLFGGDYICESPRYAEEAADLLGDAARQAPLGGFAVLGNHDISNDAKRITARLERNGIRVLRNEATPLSPASGHCWIVGIDDAILGAPNIDRAFAGVPTKGAAIALWHEPDWAELTAKQGAVLQLSGHSHGGQVRLPLLGNIAAPSGGRRFVSGLNVAAGMPVYTSRGVGIFRPPVRFLCPPEVTLLTLR